MTVRALRERAARAHGTDRRYLQVERGNASALRLYERAGFHELCAYHYRTEPLTPPRTRAGAGR
ncbi:MAG TPA: hypothetical protein VHH15_16970 [Actinophytocola sp.]|nr:hypothetical protein [Actinophytocola sp.]